MWWPKKIVVWIGNDDAMRACSAMGYEPWANARQRVYVLLETKPKKRKRRKAKKSK